MEPDILKEMQAFNFKNPVNVELIFEDSNDKMTEETSEQNFDKQEIVMNMKKSVTKNNLNEFTFNNRSNVEANKSSISDTNKYSEMNGNNNNNAKLNYNLFENNISDKPTTNKEDNNIGHYHDNLSVIEDTTPIQSSILKMVSEHLLLIMKAYNVHLSKKNSNRDKEHLEKSWNQFVKIKHYIYTKLYSTNVTVLLSQEENTNFVNNFLNDAVKLANDKRISCTYRQLASIYREMLTWTKRKQIYLNNMKATCDTIPFVNASEQQRMDRHSNTQIVSDLVSEYNNFRDINNHTSNLENTPTIPKLSKTCIFSLGTPGKEVTITADTRLLVNKSRFDSASGSRITRNCNYNNNPKIFDNNAYNGSRSRYPHLSNNTIRPTIGQYMRNSSSGNSQHAQLASQQMQKSLQTSQSYQILFNDSSRMITTNTHLNQHTQCNYLQPPQKDRILPSQMNCQNDYFHQSPNNALNQTHSNPLSPCRDLLENSLPIRQIQPTATIQNLDTQSILMQNNTGFQRTTSTDSGFVSPLHDDVIEEMIKKYFYNLE